MLVLHQWIRSFLTTVLSQLTLSKKQQWHTELFQVWFDAKEKVKVILFQNAKNMFDTEKKCGCDFRCVGLSKTAKNNLTIFNGKKSFYFDRMFSSICIILTYICTYVRRYITSDPFWFFIKHRILSFIERTRSRFLFVFCFCIEHISRLHAQKRAESALCLIETS